MGPVGYKTLSRRGTPLSSAPPPSHIFMSTEEEPSVPVPDSCVISYEVATTSILYGLPAAYQHQILRQYRGLFHQQAASTPCQYSDLNIAYNLNCQYYQNLHALEIRGTHTDSGDDSIFSTDALPPLEPVSASSDEGSPAAGDLPAPPATLSTGEPLILSVAAPETPPTATEVMNPWDAGWAEYWDSLKPSALGMTDGECPEHARTELNEDHPLRIISRYSVRDVKCDCADMLHSAYSRHAEYAFRDQDGNIVIKTSKTKLIALH
ncbi:hypothetical protein B0H19DRAFT_1268175 [Mycena capillaripes]|nr:hypothetical protein B0H19DRAFT_1268175 [Mycena capillaripes]